MKHPSPFFAAVLSVLSMLCGFVLFIPVVILRMIWEAVSIIWWYAGLAITEGDPAMLERIRKREEKKHDDNAAGYPATPHA